MTAISKRRRVAVFDLDSTLADTSQRLHYIKPSPTIDPVTGKKAKKYWGKFFAEAVNDAPLAEGVALLQRLQAEGYEIVFLTGRPEHCRADTEAWIRKYIGVEPTTLYMRKPGEFTPSAVAKTQLLLELLELLEGSVVELKAADDDVTCVESFGRALEAWQQEREAAGDQFEFEVIHATWAPTDEALAQAQQVEGRV